MRNLKVKIHMMEEVNFYLAMNHVHIIFLILS